MCSGAWKPNAFKTLVLERCTYRLMIDLPAATVVALSEETDHGLIRESKRIRSSA